MLWCSVYVVCRYGLQRAFHICLLADSRQLQCSRCSLLPTNYFGHLFYLVFHLIFGRDVHFAGVSLCAASGNSKLDGGTRCVEISGRRPRSSAERRSWPASKAGRHSAQVEWADSCGLFSVFICMKPYNIVYFHQLWCTNSVLKMECHTDQWPCITHFSNVIFMSRGKALSVRGVRLVGISKAF